MKKIIICLVICFGFILNHYSFADTGMYKFSLESFEIYRQTDQKIFGYFELDNKNEVHYPELKYILYLLPEDIKNDGGITFAADRSDPVIFSVNANETKLVAFEYDIPKDLPTNTYSLALSIYDNTSEIYAIQNKGGIKLGSSTEYIVSPNDDEINYYTIKNYEYPLSGPYMDKGESPDAYIKLKSNFSKNVTVTPQYTFYKRGPYFENTVVSKQLGEKVTLKPKQEKVMKLKLPVINEPDSWFIEVKFLDENSKVVSYEYYFRYVVNGPSAKISSINTSYDKENELMNIFINYIGSADSKRIEDARMLLEIYETSTKNVVDRYFNMAPIEPTSYKANYSIKIPDGNPLLTITATISENTKVLATKTINLSSEAVSESVKKFYDLDGTNYELPAKMLNSYGIISGYPNGTYKPLKTLSRAELTSIALNLAGVKLDNYKVTKNAFTDVDESHWAYKAINYASENGMISGYGNGLFKPNNNVKYSEALTILLNVIGYKEQANAINSTWPSNYITLANQLNITSRDPLTFNFTQPAIRGEIAILTLNTYVLRKD